MDEKIIKFEDFGVEPNSDKDATSAWNRFIARLNEESSSCPIKICFKPGRYDFYPDNAAEREYYISNHTQNQPKKCGLLVENKHRITLDGCGAEFVFHGTMIPVAIVDSTNCTLKNFSIDYQYPPVHQLLVHNVDKVQKSIICEICSSENYRIDNGNELIFTAENNSGYRFASVMPFEPSGRLCYRLADLPFTPEAIMEISPGILKISGWRDDIPIGTRLVLRVAPRPTPGIFLDHADNTKIENVTVHFALGMGLLAQLTENISLDGFSVKRSDLNGKRMFTTHADATHFSGCKGLIQVENGLYEAMADDAINVHGTYLKATEQIDEKTLRFAYMHQECWGIEWGRPGDSVKFIQPQTMDYLSNIYKIESITSVDAETYIGAKIFDIKFHDFLPDNIIGCGLENMTWTPEVIFRNNTVRNNRARGVLFSTPRKVICENNLFDHVHGSGVLLCGDCNDWYETGACHDVTIRNNRFINNLTANYQFTKAVISIYPEIPNPAAQQNYFHSNITICNNIFETFDLPLLYVKSAQYVKFVDNVIRYNNDFKAFHENQNTFLCEYTADVTIEGNIFENSKEL